MTINLKELLISAGIVASFFAVILAAGFLFSHLVVLLASYTSTKAAVFGVFALVMFGVFTGVVYEERTREKQQ